MVLDLISKISINIISILIIVLLGLIFGKFTSNILTKLLEEIEIERILKEKVNMRFYLREIILLIKYLIYFLAFIYALNQIGLSGLILNILIVIILLLLIIFILLTIKDFIPNFIAGFVVRKKKIKIGDLIKINKIHGKIEEINLLEIKIKTKKGEIIFVPNSFLLEKLK